MMRRFKDKVEDIIEDVEFSYEKVWREFIFYTGDPKKEYGKSNCLLQYIIKDICERLKKLELLTKANDYEFITKTNLDLVKKVKVK